MTVLPPADPPTPLPTPDTDFQLVERTVAGDQRAYELLVIKYQRRIERLIGRMVRDTDLVQDIAQETFIRAYRALHQFRGEAQFYTWLYRIAVNTAKKALMDMKRNPVVYEGALRGGDADDETSRFERELISEETPETVLAAQEIAQAVNTAMEALPEDLRQAVTLREIEGLSYEEIATAMECPIGTVRSRIFRAREAISARVRPLLENQVGKRW
ncbi:RNA polymerase sigma factor RpoE [Simplicispira psychrophila]|uniref:RNA polymerase sigma factor RpoE n=1 Tax=Simplicispira psychrophila TaxID=80882 RepID=UPI000482AD8F|nr:RNA polymerase sigma factor RpoE [Simplicispira psychrophila]